MSPYWTVWLDEALRLEDENRHLRLLLTVLIVQFARARDLRAYAAEAIERKAA